MKHILSFLEKFPDNTRSIILTCILGLGAGLAAVGFQIAISLIFRNTIGFLSQCSIRTFVWGSFAIVMSSSLVVGYLLNGFCKEAAGSGIPQLKKAYWKDLGYIPWRAVWVKFVAGALSIGGGASLGREGPSVHLAGGCSSLTAGLLGFPKQTRRNASVIGAAAGLAAAFNTPIAAITFVLEEIIGDLNSRFLGSVVLSSVVGAFVIYACVGKQPSFLMPAVDYPTWTVYAIAPVVAVLGSIAGLMFQDLTLRMRGRMKNASRLPPWAQPCVGGLITWMLGCSIFLLTGKVGIFGLGYDDLSTALNDGIAWKVAGVLCAGKLIATICSYGMGGCGGIFSPLLFMGGMSGIFMAGLLGNWLPFSTSDHVILAAVGMSACLGAVVRAPMTSLLIVFEMTHQFSMVPALMLAMLASQAMARVLGHHNFYDAILCQDGHDLVRIKPPTNLRAWQNMPVSSIANNKPVVLHDLAPDPIRRILRNHPFACFPVETTSGIKGLVTRDELQKSLDEKREPRLETLVACQPDRNIKDLGQQFINSPARMVVVVDEFKGAIIGLVTLHDLLRAEVSLQE